MDDITIGVTENVNNISVTAQPNDQIIDIAVTETVETVLLDVSTTVSEVSVTATQNVIVENITVDYVANENQIDINVTDATQDVTLNVTPTLIEINVLRSGGEVNILQFDSLADFPSIGSSDYFYLAKDTNKLYRWTGSAYAEISATANAVWGQIIGTLSEQTDLQNALNLKAPINSPTFTGTVSGITKSMVGLGSVDNTSDLNKPISTATQTALDAKQPLDGDLTSIAGLSGTAGFLKKNGANSWNLDNTTYLSSISSSDVTTALGFTPEDSANKGINGGYASLDGSGKVPSSQLPSYVDDVVEVANYGSLPATGETGKIYITLDTNKIYRWSGSVYVEVSSSSSVWGGITGTLSNQTDLQSALDAKLNVSTAASTYYLASNPNGYTSNTGTVTSVAMTVPSAFSVSGSPITSSGTLAITATGDTTQYIAGDGSLVTFPTIGTAGTLIREVRNTTGATLTKGTVVYISGATGNKPTVSKAIATGDSTSAQTFGLVQADIANNANGNVVCIGDLTGIDTSTLTEGAQLYLSSTTAGAYTTTKQLAPNHLVYIGIVTRAHPTLGQIEVNIQNGYELYELHDVSITSVANNDGLFYEASTDLWKNKSIATVLGYTPANGADYMALTGSQSIAGDKTFSGSVINDGDLYIKQDASYSPKTGYVSLFAGAGNILSYNFGNSDTNQSLSFPSNGRVYSFPDATGTLALTSDLHNAVTIGTANGLSLSTQVLSLGLASTSATGALSSTDWNTFNGKQNALTNPVTGTGTTSYLPKFTGTSAIGNSLLYDTGSVLLVGATSASDGQSKLELVSAGTVGFKIISSGVNGNNTFLSIQASKEWRFVTNRGDLISGNQGDLIIRNNTDSINHIILNQSGSTTFAGALSGTSATFSGQVNAASKYTWGSSTNGTTGQIATDGTNNYFDYIGSLIFRGAAASNTLVTFTSTGAATFSSNVTAGSTSSGAQINVYASSYGNNGLFNAYGTDGNIKLQMGGLGTNEAFIYTGASNKLSIFTGGNTSMTITSAGNVGIGTTSPQRLLDARGAVNLSTTSPSVASTSGAYADIHLRTWSGATSSPARITILDNWIDYFATYTDGHRFRNWSSDGVVRDLMTITGSGNVGIGTTSPSRLFEVASGGDTGYIRVTGNRGNADGVHVGNIEFYNSNTSRLVGEVRGITGAGGTQSNSGQLAFYTNDNGTYAERMRITSGGSVGIGTTQPISNAIGGGGLNVYGGDSNYPALLTLQSSSGGGALTGLYFRPYQTVSQANANPAQAAILAVDDNYSANIQFWTKTTGAIGNTMSERMRITSGGEVLINMTTTTTSGSGTMLSQGGAFANLRLFGTGSHTFSQFFLSGTAIGSITGAGSVTSYNVTSDYRLKEDLKPINGLEIVNKIKVYDYKWKAEDSRMDGVLAHELAEVLPYAVTGEKDGERMQGVDYSKIVPVLIQAIKDQQVQIEQLKNK